MKYFYKRIEDFINSLGYLETTFLDYENRIDLVNMTDNEKFCKEYVITFPLYICWGVHDTNEWSCVVDELNKMSDTSAMIVQSNGFYKNKAVRDRQLRFLYERMEEESSSQEKAVKTNSKPKKKIVKDDLSIDDLNIKF